MNKKYFLNWQHSQCGFWRQSERKLSLKDDFPNTGPFQYQKSCIAIVKVSQSSMKVIDAQYLLVRLQPTFPKVLVNPFNQIHGAMQGAGQGLVPPRQFLHLHQPPGDDLTWPLSPTNPFWSGESAAAPTAGTSWPRLAPPSSERSWRPMTLDGAGWNVLYLISCQLRLKHSRSINIWTSTTLST